METSSKSRLWAGRILSGIAVLFLTVDGMMKVLRLAPALQGTVELGYPESAVVPIGVLVLIGVVLYAIPRTSVLGAIWLTGFLGGAVATHVRVGNPLFTHTIFPTYVAAVVWGGLALRKPRVLDVILRGE
ncbi:MAG TPA: DoxX family protein [Myxococcota bacterium]|nr:DoxX family protein [Myxococcota bacterium]